MKNQKTGTNADNSSLMLPTEVASPRVKQSKERKKENENKKEKIKKVGKGCIVNHCNSSIDKF